MLEFWFIAIVYLCILRMPAIHLPRNALPTSGNTSHRSVLHSLLGEAAGRPITTDAAAPLLVVNADQADIPRNAAQDPTATSPFWVVDLAVVSSEWWDIHLVDWGVLTGGQWVQRLER